MWRLCKLGYQHEPRLMLVAFVLALLAALPDALLALWLKLLGDGVLEPTPRLVHGRGGRARRSATATWFLRRVSTRVQRRFRDKVTIALESHVARLQASVATIAHQERPEYLDRLAVLRDQVFVLDHMYMSVFSHLRLDPAAGRHGRAARRRSTRRSSCWRCSRCRRCSRRRGGPAVERAAQERGAQANRLARHLFTTATTAPPGKEVRVTGIGDRLRDASGARPGSAGTGRSPRARWRVRRLAHAGLGGLRRRATSAPIVFVVVGARTPPAGDVLLVLAAGVAPVGVHRRDRRRDRLPARHLDGRLAPAGLARGLRRVARGAAPTCPCPTRLDRRHPLRARVVRLSRHRAARRSTT